MRPTAQITLIPQDASLTITARGALGSADADRLAAVCLSLPPQTRTLVLDLTGAGLVGADALRRVSGAASSWRYARAAEVRLRFRATRHDGSGEPSAAEVAVEVRYPVRAPAPRRSLALVPRASRGRTAFTADPARRALGSTA